MSSERDRHDYTISELAEIRASHERAVSILREANARLEETIRIQQRLRNTIARVLGEPLGLRPVPEMAVWNAAEAEKR